MSLDPRIFDAALDEIHQRSRKRIYQTDYLAWAADILGRRYYARMQEIATEIATPTTGKNRTAVKSANGCGKSFLLTDVGTWWVTAFPPEESLAIFTANGRDQIERVCFKYLKDNYGYMAKRAKEGEGYPPIGWISEQLEWNYSKPDGSGKEAIAFGKRPADQDIVSSFQGTRKRRTLVALDEMGGLPEDILTAAEAVTTGEESRIAGIGNPDRRGTMFYRIFTDARLSSEWNTFTISAYDLPTMTGEKVYPNDPGREGALRGGLTAAKWIAHKERVWKTGGEIVFDEALGLDRNLTGKPDARFKAKVLGEFPDEDDRAFFAESDIQAAMERNIEPDGSVVLGVDLAAMGGDESVVFVNRGGHARVFDKTILYDDGGQQRETTGTWSREDEVTSARRVHAIAQHLGAEEVRMDAAGLGGGVAAMLMRLDEFNDRSYTLIQVIGSNSSSDRDQWANARAEHHDQVKRLLREGKVDLDSNDAVLRDQMLTITFDLNQRGAVQITKKADLRSEMHGSPDRMDALIYSLINTAPLTGNPLGDYQKGDVVTVDPWAYLQAARSGPGMPI